MTLQKDAEDLRAQLRAVRADMSTAAQQAEADRREGLSKLRQLQSVADANVCFLSGTRISTVIHRKRHTGGLPSAEVYSAIWTP